MKEQINETALERRNSNHQKLNLNRLILVATREGQIKAILRFCRDLGYHQENKDRARWHTPVISALWEVQTPNDQEFIVANLGYVKPCLKILSLSVS